MKARTTQNSAVIESVHTDMESTPYDDYTAYSGSITSHNANCANEPALSNYKLIQESTKKMQFREMLDTSVRLN